MAIRFSTSFLFLLFWACSKPVESAQGTYLFAATLDRDYSVYRIPSLIYIPEENMLIAYAEGRHARYDDGDINIVSKFSLDHGRTWSRLHLVCDLGKDTCGNPTPLWDPQTKEIVMLHSSNSGVPPVPIDRKVHLIKGRIDGQEVIYDAPIFLPEVSLAGGRDSVGPGNGIVLRNGSLLFPATQRNIISDDHGLTWRLNWVRGEVPLANGAPGGRTGEATAVELLDGALLRSDRSDGPALEDMKHWVFRRAFARGELDGQGAWAWGDYTLRDEIPVPGHYCDACGEDAYTCASCYAECETRESCKPRHFLRCQAAMIRFNNSILFLAPASAKDRSKLTLYQSTDEGDSWLPRHVLTQGNSGYSSMVQISETQVAVLYEEWFKLVFTVVDLSDVGS